MGFIQMIIGWHQRKIQERNAACDELIFRVDDALQEMQLIFSEPQTLIEPAKAVEWEKRAAELLKDIEAQNIQRFKKALRYKVLILKQTELNRSAQSFAQQTLHHNVKAAYLLIGDVEGRTLSQQQMACIVKEAHNHLVIAGAGTGKTTTVVGKIKYLLKTGKCLPKDILVLSFTNASASEMSQRIHAETGCLIAASTFHKLGLHIIAQTDGIVPKITQLNLRRFIKKQLLLNMQMEAYLRLLNSYLLYNRVAAKSEFEFKSLQEYEDYIKLNPPTTIHNETVKSYGEMDIANFLEENGIRYIYEQPYEIDTRTSEYGQYYPDFYLPEHNIYVEYFGINRKGEVPPYFKGSNGRTAAESYRISMEWKRRTHSEHQTVMIECYAYEKLEGNLLDNLSDKLKAASVPLTPKAPKELWAQVSAENDSLLSGIAELFETVINLIKSSGYDMEALKRRISAAGENVQANNAVLTLLEPIYHAYCSYLSEHKEIDFHDMINLAAEYVRRGQYLNPYKYVIVDEYQDISRGRFRLLNSMRKSREFDLFCVGDDWQSIYRFAGSDLGLTLDFSQYWGETEVSKIETTYRFSQKLTEITGGFVMKNPVQIKKSIRGQADAMGFPLGEISGYTDRYAFEFVAEKLKDLPKDSSVFFIGRYSLDAKLLSEYGTFSCQYNNVSGLVDVNYRKRPDLKMSFLTAHKSKGLQADYVFIINNKRSKMGFPSKIQDAPIVNLLLGNCDEYPYAEERRLFYVALTRARKKAVVVTVTGQESEFVSELKERYGCEINREKFECPVCGGYLLKKSGPYGEFWGCSNYRTNGCIYKRKLR